MVCKSILNGRFRTGQFKISKKTKAITNNQTQPNNLLNLNIGISHGRLHPKTQIRTAFYQANKRRKTDSYRNKRLPNANPKENTDHHVSSRQQCDHCENNDRNDEY